MTATQINGDSKTYYAAQFHFHAPSEHLVNGKQYDLCIHTVNVLESANTDKGRSYAVLGYLFEKDDYAPDMPWLAKMIKALPTSDGTATFEFDWESFSEWVPNRGSYWHYEGGLTTPGCDEAVNWHINQNIFKINPTQLAVFNNLWVKTSFNKLAGQGNNRPVMSYGSRLVHRGTIEYDIEKGVDAEGAAGLLIIVCCCCMLATIVAIAAIAKAATAGKMANVAKGGQQQSSNQIEMPNQNQQPSSGRDRQ